MAKKEVKNNETKKTTKNEKNKKTFFKSFKTELKKVVWPTPKQLVNNTVTVITIVLICAAIVFVLDLVFETINTQGIERIKQVVATNTVSDNTTSENVVEDATTEVQNEVEPTEIVTENTETNTISNGEEDNTTTQNEAQQ